MKEIVLEATLDNIPQVTAFIDEELEKLECPMKAQMQIDVAIDPLKKADPDVELPAQEREIGGLGIFLVKKTMDAMEYKRLDDQNILTIQKRI